MKNCKKYKTSYQWCIYTITNISNNKIYVGCTKNFSVRKNHHIRKLKINKHCNVYLQKAWNKYGENNFAIEILEVYDEKSIYSMENYWANLLNTHNKKYGYNIKPTSPYSNSKQSTLTKLKIKNKAIKRYKNVNNKEKIKNGLKTYFNSVGLDNIIRNYSGVLKKSFYSKKVRQYDISGNYLKSYESIREASKENNISLKCIKTNLVSHTKTGGGYIWILEEDLDREDSILSASKKSNKISVIQFDINLNIIKRFNSIREASKFLGLDRYSILQSCKKKTIIKNLYIFQYENKK